MIELTNLITPGTHYSPASTSTVIRVVVVIVERRATSLGHGAAINTEIKIPAATHRVTVANAAANCTRQISGVTRWAAGTPRNGIGSTRVRRAGIGHYIRASEVATPARLTQALPSPCIGADVPRRVNAAGRGGGRRTDRDAHLVEYETVDRKIAHEREYATGLDLVIGTDVDRSVDVIARRIRRSRNPGTGISDGAEGDDEGKDAGKVGEDFLHINGSV